MKQILKIVGSLCLLLAMSISILSCAKNSTEDSDDWITGEVDVNADSSYAKPAKNDDDDSNAYQSSERVTLPTVPVD